MAAKYTIRTYKQFIAVVGIALTLSPCVRAEGCKCRCEPSTAVYHSPFFGYYRTCWRPWPGGQPLCPRYPIPSAEERALPAGTTERTIEQLPAPRPEEPEKP